MSRLSEITNYDVLDKNIKRIDDTPFAKPKVDREIEDADLVQKDDVLKPLGPRPKNRSL